MRIEKLLALFAVLLCSLLGQSQDNKFTIDYTATYLVNKSLDTISIGVGDGGRYLFSNSEKLTQSFSKSFGGSFPNMIGPNADAKIMLDMQTSNLSFLYSSNENLIGAKFNLANFSKAPNSDKTESLLAQETDETIIILDKEYRLYSVSPKSDVNDSLNMAFDEDYSFDYNTNFTRLLKIILGNEVNIELPNGILIYARDGKGNNLIELLSITKEDKKGTINFSFNLE